jgi:hypothetical protein
MDALLSIFTVVDIISEVVGDPGDVLTDYQLWAICQKCQLLFCVLSVARGKMLIVQNWDDICLEALEAAKRVGISIMKASPIVRNYYQDFRLIEQVDGYLGSFDRKLNVGDTQTMIFSADNDGPFWMTPTEREMKQKDTVMPNKTVKRKYTKDELILKLQEKVVSASGNMKNIERLCRNKTQLGWEGQPKGMLEILWEHGWITWGGIP